MSYTLFIDESGDEGIRNDQLVNGASPLFFLGAFLINQSEITNVRHTLDDIEFQIGKTIHFNSLNHSQRIFTCQSIVELPITAFGVVSDKAHLDRGNYRERIEEENYKFYNKNVSYLLEMVGEFCEENGIIVSSVILEERANMNYNRLRNYISTIQQKPIHERAKLLRHFSVNDIISRSKTDEPLLKISDAISNALYKACIPDKLNVTETRYTSEIKTLFAGDKNGYIRHKGICAVREFSDLNAPAESRDFLLSLSNRE